MLQRRMCFCVYIFLGLIMINPIVCMGEESDDIYVPLDAVQLQGTIDSIVESEAGEGDMIIDDILYRFTASTKYLTAEKKPVSMASFSEGQFVNLVARKATLLTLWPAEREDGEEAPQIQQPRENGLQLKDGVWVN